MSNPRTHRPGPGFAGDAVEHVRLYHGVMDLHSKNILRTILRGALDSHAHIVKGLAGTATQAWFEDTFKNDVAAVNDAISLLDSSSGEYAP